MHNMGEINLPLLIMEVIDCMPKLIDNLYMKDSSDTARQIADTDGYLYQRGAQITATAAQLNATDSYLVVQAHKSSVGSSLTDAEVFEFTSPAALTLVGVQVYCTAVTAVASVDVKEAGVSVLSGAVTPSANSVVTGTISDAGIASGAAVTVHVTTDAAGTITDLTVTLIFKTAHV